MATRKQMSELIIRQLAGGDPQWSFRWGDEREIQFHMDMVRDRLMWSDIMANDDINDNYIITYENIPVLYDQPINQYYFDFPARPLTLPKNKAIRQISRMKAQNEAFAIISGTRSPFLTGLAGLLDATVAIKIVGNKGYFHNLQGGMDCGLLVMMIPIGKDVKEDEQYCPPHLEEPIKETTLKELGFGLGITEDKANDKA